MIHLYIFEKKENNLIGKILISNINYEGSSPSFLVLERWLSGLKR